MADGAVIGALRVVLGADTVQFEQALKKGEAALEGFAKQFGKIGIGIAAGIAAAATGLALGVKNTIDQADKLNKVSQKIGVPVEQLSALKYAAELADVELEALTTSMGKLAKNMSAVAGGAQNDAAKAFKALGIEVKNSDGTLKSSNDIMLELAGTFSGLEDGAAKTALAIAIFGKAGAQMIPLLNAGKSGLEESTEEAKKFGIIIDTKTAKAAEAFNDNLKRLSAIMQGVFVKVTAESVGGLEAMSQAMVDVSKNSTALETVASVISGAFRVLAAIVVSAGAAFAQWGRDLALVRDILKGLGTPGAVGEAIKKWREESKAATAATNDQVAGLLGMHSAMLPVIDDWTQLTEIQKTKTLKAAPILETKTAIDKFIESTQKSIASQKAELETFGQAEGARARLKVQLEAQTIAKQEDIKLTDKQKAAVNALGLEVESLTNKIQGQQLIADSLPIWDQYQMAIEKARQSIAGLNPTLEQTAAVNKKIAEKFGLTWEQQSASIAGSMGDIVDTFAGENKKMIGIAKTLHAAQALIAAYAGAAEALALPFPANLAASATVLAKGLALVMAIKNIGFAKGGSFKVGGGTTGVDSEMVAFKATPGEMVDVRRPGDQGPATEITLAGIRPRDMFTGEMLRDLFESLNAGMADGYKLKVAS